MHPAISHVSKLDSFGSLVPSTAIEWWWWCQNIRLCTHRYAKSIPWHTPHYYPPIITIWRGVYCVSCQGWFSIVWNCYSHMVVWGVHCSVWRQSRLGHFIIGLCMCSAQAYPDSFLRVVMLLMFNWCDDRRESWGNLTYNKKVYHPTQYRNTSSH